MAFDSDELNKRREERAQERKFMAAQMRLLKIGSIVTAVVMVVCVAAILITQGLVRLPKPTEPSSSGIGMEATTVPPTTEPPAPTEPDTVIHFAAGGDVNVTDKVVSAGAAVSGYDYSDIFLDVLPVLSGADMTAVNFEGVLAGEPYGAASAPQQLMAALRNAGVDLVQTANSRSISKGLRGLQSTISAIRNAGLENVGTFTDAEEFQKTGGFVIREIQGIRVAVVAFTKGMDGAGLPAGSENCVNLLYTDYSSTYQDVDTKGITAILKSVEAQKPDVTIALLHWGSEFNDQISQSQDEIRELMLAQGVDAIIGTHPHYVQEMVYDEAAGTFIAYSLGDLLGDGDTAGTNYSVLLDLEITRSGATGEIKITGFDYIPIFLEDKTATGEGMKLLRIREAITAYEQNFVGKVSEETYLAMKSALSRIEERVSPD